MVDEPKPIEPMDPVIATGCAVAADENGVTLLFTRPVFSPNGSGVNRTLVGSAAVTMTWQLFAQMVEAGGATLLRRDEKIKEAMAKMQTNGAESRAH